MMKYEEIERQVSLRFAEIEKITKERLKKENILRKQIDKKLKMLMNGGFSKMNLIKCCRQKFVILEL